MTEAEKLEAIANYLDFEISTKQSRQYAEDLREIATHADQWSGDDGDF